MVPDSLPCYICEKLQYQLYKLNLSNNDKGNKVRKPQTVRKLTTGERDGN